MGKWKEYKINDIVEKICVGFVGACQKFYCEPSEGVPMIRTTNLTERNISFQDVKYVTHEFHTKNKKSQLKFGDILVARHGDNGKACMYLSNIEANCLNAVIIRPDFQKVNPKFFLYQFNSPVIRDTIESMSSGSVQDVINTKQIQNLEILLPERQIQDEIAAVLSSLDDKIDLLHRQNATLEKMAETLFRKWFVEDAREDWNGVKVKDVCVVITKGTTPTTLGKSFKDLGINFIKAESLTDVGTFIPEKFAFIDEDTNEILNRSKIQKGDILITIAGTIGRIGYVTEEILPANTNQAIGIMRVNSQVINAYFLYCLFKTSEIRNDFDGRVVHAVQPNLSLSQIGDIEFKMPPKKILHSGMEQIESLFIKKNKNTTQIRTLTKLRDTFLPKLMSGEVRVK